MAISKSQLHYPCCDNIESSCVTARKAAKKEKKLAKGDPPAEASLAQGLANGFHSPLDLDDWMKQVKERRSPTDSDSKADTGAKKPEPPKEDCSLLSALGLSEEHLARLGYKPEKFLSPRVDAPKAHLNRDPPGVRHGFTLINGEWRKLPKRGWGAVNNQLPEHTEEPTMAGLEQQMKDMEAFNSEFLKTHVPGKGLNGLAMKKSPPPAAQKNIWLDEPQDSDAAWAKPYPLQTPAKPNPIFAKNAAKLPLLRPSVRPHYSCMHPS